MPKSHISMLSHSVFFIMFRLIDITQLRYLGVACGKGMTCSRPLLEMPMSPTGVRYACWKYWQQQLPPDEVRQLLLLLDQPHDAPRSIRRFLDRFKQYAPARQIDESVLHLASRISRNGWTYGPSFEFLEWLAHTPVSHVSLALQSYDGH